MRNVLNHWARIVRCLKFRASLRSFAFFLKGHKFLHDFAINHRTCPTTERALQHSHTHRSDLSHMVHSPLVTLPRSRSPLQDIL